MSWKDCSTGLRSFISECSFRPDVGGELASMILCTEFKGLPLVVYVAMLPEFRNRGYARFLLKKVLDAAQRLGYGEVSLVVTDGNDAAIKAYRDVGFKAETGI
ncbi:GNAT family N-acetyltransferase [Bifidobacterium sp. ESL0798]|uniref:GNAT family N-acetyltransferase n=1 Tax=Bifidobacterium sp. ESL0798 TaxID=2983235 RepID=UPI0023F76557|nr:GNAT family N-acetyltransferase [Bifidobacterium sp. ESL0798]WEV74094.1 GNAT family N-acetyltransferase [Bifidobacterium sp. ESL0798]